MRKFSLLLFMLVSIVGCENLLVNDAPSSSHLSSFNVFWNDFDQHYTGFAQRNIDWDSTYQASIQKIELGTADQEFFNVLSRIILSFKDGHVELRTPLGNVRYEHRNAQTAARIASLSNYLNPVVSASQTLSYSTVKSENIGYISIPSYTNRYGKAAFERIDEVLTDLKTTDGIILDLRNNGGGEYINTKTLASRLIAQPRVYIQGRGRTGPEHHDFGDPIRDTILPEGPYQYVKPIAILTNRQSASAAEVFIQGLKGLSYVDVVGDTTAGDIGLTVWRELPNGWNYRMTVTLTSNADEISYEGIGIPPDYPVLLSKQDSLSGVDTQLEKAIELLR